MAGLAFSNFDNTYENNNTDFSARAIDKVLGDYNANTNIDTNKIPAPNDTLPETLKFSSTNYVPLTSKLEEKQDDIPSSFDDYIGPPFKPIHIRELYDKFKNPNYGKRLEPGLETSQLVANPNMLLPGSEINRLELLSERANKKAEEQNIKEKFYNLSLSQIGNNIVDTVVDIIDELWDYEWHTGIEGLIDIFVKNDRLIYLGMITMVFSFLILLIREVDR